jgi:hypothetical protein
MALTLDNVRRGVDQFGKRTVEADVTFDSSYASGGEAVDMADLPGLSQVERVELVFVCMPDGAAGDTNTHGAQVYPVLTSPTAPKLKLYTSADTEASGDQSGVTQRVRFVGH